MSFYEDVAAKIEDLDLILVIEAKVHWFQELVDVCWAHIEKGHYNQLHKANEKPADIPNENDDQIPNADYVLSIAFEGIPDGCSLALLISII